MSGWSTLQRAALCTVELTCLRKVPFPPASSVMWPSPSARILKMREGLEALGPYADADDGEGSDDAA